MSNIERRPQPAAQELCRMMLSASRKLRDLRLMRAALASGTADRRGGEQRIMFTRAPVACD
jgi:hypothetical protein